MGVVALAGTSPGGMAVGKPVPGLATGPVVAAEVGAWAWAEKLMASPSTAAPKK
jgi:hypothetical protein